MRFVHTSDWHLGKRFGELSLLAEQRAFAQWLIDFVVHENVDAVLCAGDIFDRAVPPIEAVELFRNILTGLRAVGVEFIGITGNHDSPERIAVFDGLTDSAGIILRGGFCNDYVAVRTYHGETVNFITIPYLDPLKAPFHLDYDGEATTKRLSHGEVLDHVLTGIRSQSLDGPTVVLSHAFVAGAAPSESERDINVGGSAAVPIPMFDGFDYVALGHLHRPQQVGTTGALRYSGSPLPYSFSETHPKGVVLVEINGGVLTDVTPIEHGVGRPVSTITGTLEHLCSGKEFAGQETHFVRAVLTDAMPVLQPFLKLRGRFPFLIEMPPRTPLLAQQRTAAQDLAITSAFAAPHELAKEFWSFVNGEPPNAEQSLLLDHAFSDATGDAQ